MSVPRHSHAHHVLELERTRLRQDLAQLEAELETRRADLEALDLRAREMVRQLLELARAIGDDA